MRSLLTTLAAAAAFGSLAVALPVGRATERHTVVATPRFVPAAGPILAGEGRVVWLTRRDDRVLDMWVTQPGQGPRRVQRFSGSDEERLRSPRLSASATEVALELSEARAAPARGARRVVASHAYRGAFGEPLRAVQSGAQPLAFADPQRRSAWVMRACVSAEIRVGRLPEPRTSSGAAVLPAASSPCALRLRSPARVRGGRLLLGVSCAGFRIDCAAEVTVRAGGRLIARGPARYNHATPPYAAANLALTAAGARLLQRGARTRVRVAASIREAAQRVDASQAATVTRSTSRTITRAGR